MQPIQIAEANKARGNEVARRTRAAIEEMRTGGERISFYSVAKRAQVARSTLYRRPDLRRLVEGARGEGAAAIAGEPDAASDVERLEGELARVRRERDELREAMGAMRPVRYHLVSFDMAA